MDLGEIRLEGTTAAIKKLKNYKCGGPDRHCTELFKAMDIENTKTLTDTLNIWWNQEEIELEALQARVVHIYKKGCTSDLANYRPISLLNTMYKIFASIIQKRLADGIDAKMMRTQYGFRKARSTQHAIHIIRRILEVGEGTTSRLIMVLLDWEKAFDKLTRKVLFQHCKDQTSLTNDKTHNGNIQRPYIHG